ncbi:MAG: TetR/AcrR family transcriptional regulator [Byssovorax sp.]
MPLGRPRAFDVDEALDQALQVFWRKGYEGTSLSDLTEAMGINRPSLYAAFGNKEELFRKALDRYADGLASHVGESFDEPTARGVVERLLRSIADALGDPRNPRGCLMVQGALSCGESADPVRQELISRRAELQDKLCKRLERALAEGDLPAGSNPADLARYVTTISHGLAVHAASGASHDELRRIVEMALRAWPT